MGTKEIDGVKYTLEEEVRLAIGEGMEGCIRGIIFRKGCVTYEVLLADATISEFYDFELAPVTQNKQK